MLNTGRLDLGAVGRVAAANDLVNRGGTIAGGDLLLTAGRDLRIDTAGSTSEVATVWSSGRRQYGASLETATVHRGGAIEATGDLTLVAGRDLTVTGSRLTAAGDLLLAADTLTLASALDSSSTSKAGRAGKTRFSETASETRNLFSGLSAGGDVTLLTPGALTVRGATVEAGGGLLADAGSIDIAGVIDSASFASDRVRKSSGMFSSTRTMTRAFGADETVVASTLSGATVALRADGDVAIAAANVVASDGLAIRAGGALTVGTLAAEDVEAESLRIRKSGISLSGDGLFAGVARNRTGYAASSLTHTGSLIGSAGGDVLLAAGDALTVTGSRIAGTGDVRLQGETVSILNATDLLETAQSARSSSFGVSIRAYENVSQAVRSVSSLPDRISSGAAGGAPETAITAVSEVTRSVRSVMTALTNTAGVSASLGFSSSRSSGAGSSETVIGSSVSGGNVAILAGEDAIVRGSTLVASRDLLLSAGRDVILEAAEAHAESRSSSRSSGASIGVTVGVGVGGVTASANAGVSSGRSRGESGAVTHANAQLSAGETLTLAAARDIRLSGAVAEGRDVIASAGRDLTIESLQDLAWRNNSGGGINLGLSLSPTSKAPVEGASGGFSVSRGTANSALVVEQSALFARGGSLSAEAAGTTTLTGGILAAIGVDGTDSGLLSLSTGVLRVSDLADASRSRDVSVGVSAAVNDPFQRGIAGANTPVVDASYAAATLRQETRGTLGQGAIAIGDTAASTALAGINRDLAASQVVTRDSRTGFTVYADEAAIRETINLAGCATGNAAACDRSTIATGISKLVHDPAAMLNDVIAEAKAIANGVPGDSQVELLLAELLRIANNQAITPQQARTVATAQSGKMLVSIVGESPPTPEQQAAAEELNAALQDLLMHPNDPMKKQRVDRAMIGLVDATPDDPRQQAIRKDFLEMTGGTPVGSEPSDITVQGYRQYVVGTRLDNASIYLGEKKAEIEGNVAEFVAKHPAAGLVLTASETVGAVINPLGYAVNFFADKIRDRAEKKVGEVFVENDWEKENKAKAGGEGTVFAIETIAKGATGLAGLGGILRPDAPGTGSGPVGGNVDGRTMPSQGESPSRTPLEIPPERLERSPWTQISSDARAVARDIEAATGRAIPVDQRTRIAEQLRNNDHRTRVSDAEYKAIGREYSKVRSQMIKDWEAQNGRVWPEGAELHHIIPQRYGGPNQWWNAHPALPSQHQGGIHRRGSPTQNVFSNQAPRR